MADEIDLLNISFDGQFAPDRISAKAGLKELKRVAPSRRYATASEVFHGPVLLSTFVVSW